MSGERTPDEPDGQQHPLWAHTPGVSTRPPETLSHRMPDFRIGMNRRRYLASGAAAVTLGTAGCLDSVFGGSPGATGDVVLDTPDRYEDLRESRDQGFLPPIHADELPGATVTDALSGREISTREYVGERHTLLTFIFTRCTMVCPGLTAALAFVQTDARDKGYDDELAFIPITFDPEHDTPEELESFCEKVNAVPDARAWHALRPESPQRAREVVGDQFGVFFEKLSEAEIEQDEERPSNMVFNHTSLIVLANADGYVERGYTGSRVPAGPGLLETVETLRDRW